MHRFPRLLITLVLLAGTINAVAAPLAPQDVPAPLQPWIKWVLHGQEQRACPILYNNGDEHRCGWPARLSLNLDRTSGRFTQQWLMASAGWVPLPGDARHWPQDVLIDQKPAAVLVRTDRPYLYVEKGSHVVSGTFAWEHAPEALTVPSDTGIVALTLNNQVVPLPDLDSDGRLWLRQTEAPSKNTADDHLTFNVYRRLTDSIPSTLTTHIDLEVSGKHREVVLGQVMAPDFIPMSLISPLPARLQANGLLRVQVRPGRWTLTFTARHNGPITALTLTPQKTLWPAEEIWVFDARPQLRVAVVEGVQAIDPQQTELPLDWRQLPAYRLQPGDSLRLVERKRGDANPAPDQLTLHRKLWLDFAGRTYTAQDRIRGTVTATSRLEIASPAALGRVNLAGEDQFITRLPGSERAGVEVRGGSIDMTADSRMQRQARLPVTGWNHDFQKVSGELYLPPGWRLLHATGVDYVQDTWLKRWTLLDLFLVLIIALAMGKLWSRAFGILALVTLVLIAHETDAPRWIWLHPLAAIALLRVVPAGWPQRWLLVYRNVSLVVILLMVIPFMVTQVREGIYPQLQQPWMIMDQQPGLPQAEDRAAPAASAPAAEGEMTDEMLEEKVASLTARKMKRYAMTSSVDALSKTAPPRPKYYDPNAAVQTGPGLPLWQWRSIPVRWNGPVERTQEMRLLMLPPSVNTLLAFMRVLLLALLVLGLLNIRIQGQGRGRFPRFTYTGGVTAMFALMLFLPLLVHADSTLPPPELLKELENRLLTKPECLPQCATITRVRLEASANALRLRLDINSQAEVAVPLPGQAAQWLPQTVLVDGQPARGLARTAAGELLLAVGPGRHQVVMEGALSNRSLVQIPFPLKPQRVDISAHGWLVEGVHEDGVVDDQVQLRRTQVADGKKNQQALETNNLPPFVHVERTLVLGVDWRVETRLIRVSPPGAALALEIPLLPGESVTSEQVRVRAGKAAISLAANQTELRWSSLLAKGAQLILKASDTDAWTEIWRLDVSPLWHVEMEGIPVVSHQSAGVWLPEWRPWPGEQVTLKIARPEGLSGKTLTVDQSSLTVTPGLRATEYQMQFTLRSSRGGQHVVHLPPDAVLLSVAINDAAQPLRPEGDQLSIPLVPGTQNVALVFRLPQGVGTWFRVAPMNLAVDSVNAQMIINAPQDRWTLLAGGPAMGPAILFWGVLLVVVLVAVGLGRVPLTPLKTRHWVLLGIGLSPVSIGIALLIVGWLLALGWRRSFTAPDKKILFNSVQVGLALWTLVALLALVYAIKQGLLGLPDMQIAGNGSSAYHLQWYQDRIDSVLPQPWVISVPILFYRLAMLAWALWLAFALLHWLHWGWESYRAHGLWQASTRIKPTGGRKAKTPETPGPK